jgi:hypothetical protein
MKSFCKYLFDCFEITQNNQIKSLKWWINGVSLLNLTLLLLTIIAFAISIYVFKNGFIVFLLPYVLLFFLINYILLILGWLLSIFLMKMQINFNAIKILKIYVFLSILLIYLSCFLYMLFDNW